jgi:hypothetical protein
MVSLLYEFFNVLSVGQAMQKNFGKRVQINGFSPVCTLECSIRWLDCAKDFGQRVQLNGFSPE